MSLKSYAVTTITPPDFPALWRDDCGANGCTFWDINSQAVTGTCPFYKSPVDAQNMALLSAAISTGCHLFIDCTTFSTTPVDFVSC